MPRVPSFIRSERVIEALGALGIGETENVDRVVIDLRAGHIPIIHVRRHGDSRLLELVDALADGPRIEWVEAPAETPPDMPEYAMGYLPSRSWPGPVDVKPDPWPRERSV